jgi:hypothetical protein
VTAKQKRRSPKQKHEADAPVAGVLQKFHCDNITYELTVPIELFDTKAFYRKTGIGRKMPHWSTVLPSDKPTSGYHVHFRGRIEAKRVRVTVEYWEGMVQRTDQHPKPSAESIMKWLGSLIKSPSMRTFAHARFEKPLDRWRSRFNLPFKVTMAGAEVTITGVTLVLPNNRFRATNGFVSKMDKVLGVAMAFVEPLEFSNFDIGVELLRFNEAIEMIVEAI